MSRDLSPPHSIRETDYVTVPADTYRVRIVEVREAETRAGHTLWSVHLVVTDGEFAHRVAAWDSLVFSPRGSARVAQIYEALGVSEFAGDKVTPESLVGREVLVTIRAAEYLSASGEVIRRNEVLFDGWEALS